jgi:2-hydroxychromene-2-carboxylate isomerase
MTASILFYFDFSSSYSYIAQSRVAEIEQRTGARVEYRPIVLGAVFHHLQHSVPPADSVKMSYLNRDLQRLAQRAGVVYKTPPMFPFNAMESMRIFYALDAVNQDAARTFANAVFAGAYAEGLDMSSVENVSLVLGRLGEDRDSIVGDDSFALAKARLKEETQRAIESNVFGAPSFVCGDELYWGADRIEMMIEDIT